MKPSFLALVWATNARGLSPGAFRVLVEMAKRVGRRGYDIWPSHETIAEDAETSVSSVRRHIQELQSEGFIKVVGARVRQDGGRGSNTYRLLVDVVLTYANGTEVREHPAQPYVDEMGPEPDDFDEDEPPLFKLNDTPVVQHTPPAHGRAGGCSPASSPPCSPVDNKPDSERTSTNELFDTGALAPAVSEISDIIDQVAERWNAMAARHPGPKKARLPLDDARRNAIRTRSKRLEPGQTVEQLWDQFFERIEDSEFLQGRSAPSGGRSEPFSMDMTWALGSAKFNKIMEGTYGNRHVAGDTHTADGSRRLGPAEQATARALARFLPSGQRGG